MNTQRDDILAQAAAWHEQGHAVAIATVIATWGSSPFPPGSQLVVDERGRFVGSVSGGCVEGAVVSAARAVIASGQSRVMDFGVADAEAFEVGLACGGRVSVFIESLA